MAKFAFKKKVLPSVMAATLASGMTLSGNANAINMAENGIGQVLLGPVYLVDFGYTTKVSIVNTRTDVAVKAKIVIRSSREGTELLDFICYLSPADVCRFEIREMDADGDGDTEVVMYSDDDSIKSPVPSDVSNVQLVDSLEKSRATFASILPVAQPLFTHNLQSNDTDRMGQIEVFGLYGVEGTVTGYRPRISGANRQPIPVSITVIRGMAKFALAQIFDTPRYPEHDNSNLFWQPIVPLDEANPPTEQQERNAGPEAPYSPLSGSQIRSTDPSWIQLTGEVEMVNPGVDRIGYRFPALAGSIGDNVDFPYTTPSGLPGDAAVWDGLVVSNPRWDATIAGETGIGVGFGIDPFGNRADKTVEIEAALATTNLIDTFEDSSKSTYDTTGKRTRVLVTFPTRYRHKQGINPCGAAGVAGYSAPFESDGNTIYSLTALNNFEQFPGATITTPPPIVTGTPFSGGPASVPTTPTTPTPTPVTTALVGVNYFIPNWPETEVDENGIVLTGVTDFRGGWFDMSLSAKAGCENYYPGLAAIGFTHKYVQTSTGSYTQSWFVATARKPVWCCDSENATTSCPSKPW
jgi:hypothetical protein